MKGLTRKQATQIAKTMRLHKNQVYKIYIDEGKIVFNKIEQVEDSKKEGALFTGSWNRLLDIQHKLTQALLADILYAKVNSDINKLERESRASGESKKENKYPKLDLEEYISKEQIERLIRGYYEQLNSGSNRDNRIQYIFYNRQRDIVYLANGIDRVRSSYLTMTQVYDIERYHGKVDKFPQEQQIKKLTEHAYKEVNEGIRYYWKDLYTEYEDEL